MLTNGPVYIDLVRAQAFQTFGLKLIGDERFTFGIDRLLDSVSFVFQSKLAGIPVSISMCENRFSTRYIFTFNRIAVIELKSEPHKESPTLAEFEQAIGEYLDKASTKLKAFIFYQKG